MPDSQPLPMTSLASPEDLKSIFVKLLGQEDDIFILYCLETFDTENPDWNYLIEYVRERFNIGNWSDVSLFWRKAYTVIRYITCINLLNENKNYLNMEWLLNLLDDALIMGYSEELNKKITEIATWAQSVIVENSPITTFPKEYPNVEIPAINLAKFTAPQEVISELKRIHQPSLTDFLEMLTMGIPVIITGSMSHWAACNPQSDTYWSPSFWSKTCGNRTVPIEVGSAYTDENWGQRLLTVNSFFENFILSTPSNSRLGYLAQHQILLQIPELANDVDIPDYCYCGLSNNSSDATVDSCIWVGPANTISPLHHDSDRANILCQLIGYKYVKLYTSDQTDRIYPHTEKMLCNTSQIDVASSDPDLKRFPKFIEARGFHGVLGPREMLFIPPRCWHYVKSLTSSISMNFWWTVANRFIPEWPGSYAL